MVSFQFVPPSLVVAYYLHSPDERAIFLSIDLTCKDTCPVTGGWMTYGGGAQTEKIKIILWFEKSTLDNHQGETSDCNDKANEATWN